MTLDRVINLLAMLTLFEMMVSIGLGVTWNEVVSVARNRRLMIKAALANYVCVPAITLGLLFLFQPLPLIAVGFLIAAVCPGAPYGPPFTSLAKGNTAVSIGLMALLAGSSALFAPILLSLLLPWVAAETETSVQIDALKIVITLLFAQLLPLCLGMSFRQWRPAVAGRIQKPSRLISLVLNLILLGLIIWSQFDMLLSVSMRGYLGMGILVIASMGCGWLLGGPERSNRTAMAMATSVRNVGVALVIATGSFPGTPVVTATTVFAIFQTVMIAFLAGAWGRLANRNPLPPSNAADAVSTEIVNSPLSTNSSHDRPL